MVKTAIILAGGKGERMRPHTDTKPKAMVSVGGRPAVLYQVLQFKNFGIEEIIFACSYKKEYLKDYFKDGSAWGLNIHYSEEDTPIGRGGAIKQAMKLVQSPGEDVIVTNGDNLWKLDLTELVTTHETLKPQATLVVVSLRSPYGIVEINNDNQVIGFKEKPLLPFWINAGVYIFSKAILDLLPESGDHEESTFPNLKPEEFVAFKSSEYWRGFDTVKDLSDAEKEVEEQFAELFMGQRLMSSS